MQLDVATEFLDTNVIVGTEDDTSETSRPTPEDIEKRLQVLRAFTSLPLSDYALSRESIYNEE